MVVEGIVDTGLTLDWVFQTGCEAPGFTSNERGTSRPCLLPPLAVKPARGVQVQATRCAGGR